MSEVTLHGAPRKKPGLVSIVAGDVAQLQLPTGPSPSASAERGLPTWPAQPKHDAQSLPTQAAALVASAAAARTLCVGLTYLQS